MSADPSNGVSTREHIEQIISRIELSVREQIGALRDDIKHLQNNYVTRSEHKLTTDQLQREIERLDRDQRDGFERLDEEQAKAIKELKDDIRNGQNRALALVGFGIAIFEFIFKFLLNT